MGLDMYLYRYPKSKTKEQIEKESDELWNKSIEEWRKGWQEVYEIAYWRKVNFLHGWFVCTLAGNVDECQEIAVRKCNMESLKVLVDKACPVILKAKFIPQKDISAKDDWKAKYVDDPDKEAIPVVWNADEGKFEGVDKNTPYRVSDEAAKELSEILPYTEGFFFGSYCYGLWYAWEMLLLQEKLDKLLADWDDEKYTYIYEASW
jgi:hypothetical protein